MALKQNPICVCAVHPAPRLIGVVRIVEMSVWSANFHPSIPPWVTNFDSHLSCFVIITPAFSWQTKCSWQNLWITKQNLGISVWPNRKQDFPLSRDRSPSHKQNPTSEKEVRRTMEIAEYSPFGFYAKLNRQTVGSIMWPVGGVFSHSRWKGWHINIITWQSRNSITPP